MNDSRFVMVLDSEHYSNLKSILTHLEDETSDTQESHVLRDLLSLLDTDTFHK